MPKVAKKKSKSKNKNKKSSHSSSSKSKGKPRRSKILVIVESPAKARTINRYLKSEYIVEACMGHVIDLPKSRMAVDVKNNFSPEYITVRGKAQILNRIKRLAAGSKKVLIAADPDREGEAISWHIKNAITKSLEAKKPAKKARKLSDKELKVTIGQETDKKETDKKEIGRSIPIKRVAFNEISEDSIRDVIMNENMHREIDMNLVHAQQARRILDRLVGYNISPILWKKIKGGLSAGRVQSVALKKICDREETILRFQPKEYWKVHASLQIKRAKLSAELIKWQKKKTDIPNKEFCDSVCAALQHADFSVAAIRKRERKRHATAPYTTSRLQQDAANRLGFPSQKTMIVAQQLYEGIALGTKDVSGLITYMRTDSTRVSDKAKFTLHKYILENFGKQYLEERKYQTSKRAQDAHEAIRPVNVHNTPEKIEKYLSKEQLRLYRLIWSKFTSSQMAAEISEQHTIEIQASCDGLLTARESKVLFDGFAKVFHFTKEKDIESKGKLPELHKGDRLELLQLDPSQHFTQPPPRFNDASLVKILEESGVGRPSTYAPTVQTLIRRYYITRLNKAFEPTEVGKIVNGVMETHFSDLVDTRFTAQMEEALDQIAQGNNFSGKETSSSMAQAENGESKLDTPFTKINAGQNWTEMLSQFYLPFSKKLSRAAVEIEDMKSKLDKPTDFVCEKCGTKMVKRLGRNGYFLACPRFPDCRNAQSIPMGPCPVCDDGTIVKKSMRKQAGRHFYGCTKYPDCTFITRHTTVEEKCTECQRILFAHSTKERGHFSYCMHCEPEYFPGNTAKQNKQEKKPREAGGAGKAEKKISKKRKSKAKSSANSSSQKTKTA